MDLAARIAGSAVAIAAMAWAVRRMARRTITPDLSEWYALPLLGVTLVVGSLLASVPLAIGGEVAFGAAMVVVVALMAEALLRPELEAIWRERRRGTAPDRGPGLAAAPLALAVLLFVSTNLVLGGLRWALDGDFPSPATYYTVLLPLQVALSGAVAWLAAVRHRRRSTA